MATLKAGNMNKGAITTPQDMLTGKVPGLLIVPGDGQPGSGTTIRIRNGSSLSASNSPLIVIDGVTTSDDAGVGMSNVLGALNPEDIESFSVLKMLPQQPSMVPELLMGSLSSLRKRRKQGTESGIQQHIQRQRKFG